MCLRRGKLCGMALLTLPLLPWKRTWPLGSHPLLVILILLHIPISTFSCSPPLSLPGPPILGSFMLTLAFSSLKLKGDHGFPACHISASPKCSQIGIFRWAPCLELYTNISNCWVAKSFWIGNKRFTLISKSASSCFPKLFSPFHIPYLAERYLHPPVWSGQKFLPLALCPDFMLSNLLSDFSIPSPFLCPSRVPVLTEPRPTLIWRIKHSG